MENEPTGEWKAEQILEDLDRLYRKGESLIDARRANTQKFVGKKNSSLFRLSRVSCSVLAISRGVHRRQSVLEISEMPE